jgi:bifunctional DNase/RNase
MARQRLKYKGLADIVGSEGMCVIMLTDEPETRCLNIICDKTMSQQLQMRTGHLDICNCLLPEVLMKFLGDYVPVKKMEINIQNILDGQYLVGLMNTDNYAIHRIRLSDAVLLHLIADVPLYIDEQLMKMQSSPYTENQTKLSIPLNTLETEKLKEELQRAIEDEDYRLASNIKEELNKRESFFLNIPGIDQTS